MSCHAEPVEARYCIDSRCKAVRHFDKLSANSLTETVLVDLHCTLQ